MLPSSGPISTDMINVELGRNANVPLNIPIDPDIRTLTGVPSGPITAPDDFWGKSFTPLRPIAWTGSPSQSFGSSSTTSVTYTIRSNGEVLWSWTASMSGGADAVGNWTTPIRFADDGVQARFSLIQGGVVSGNVGSWANLNTGSATLSVSKTTGSPTTLLVEIRRNGGPVQASWQVTLVA